MQTTERFESTEATVDDERLTKRNRALGWLSGVLAVTVIGLGAWLIFDSGSEAADLTPVQEQMLETIDTYLNAWNTGDGDAAVALMSASGYHDNGGARYAVAEGELESFIERVGQSSSFSVSRSDAAFVGDYVMSTEHIPADSDVQRPSIYWMSTDGTRILWHLAP